MGIIGPNTEKADSDDGHHVAVNSVGLLGQPESEDVTGYNGLFDEDDFTRYRKTDDVRRPDATTREAPWYK